MCNCLRFDQEEQDTYCEASNPGDADECWDCPFIKDHQTPETIAKVKFAILMECAGEQS